MLSLGREPVGESFFMFRKGELGNWDETTNDGKKRDYRCFAHCQVDNEVEHGGLPMVAEEG